MEPVTPVTTLLSPAELVTIQTMVDGIRQRGNIPVDRDWVTQPPCSNYEFYLRDASALLTHQAQVTRMLQMLLRDAEHKEEPIEPGSLSTHEKYYQRGRSQARGEHAALIRVILIALGITV